MTGNTASGLETITVSVGDSFMTLKQKKIYTHIIVHGCLGECKIFLSNVGIERMTSDGHCIYAFLKVMGSVLSQGKNILPEV